MIMPPFLCRVEVVPKPGNADPYSVNMKRDVKNSGIEGCENVHELTRSQVITFIVECANKNEALAQAKAMSDDILVNPVLATPNISVSEQI